MFASVLMRSPGDLMRALEKKMFRDFLRLWSQGLAIALVMACGVSIFLMSYGMFIALTDTRDA